MVLRNFSWIPLSQFSFALLPGTFYCPIWGESSDMNLREIVIDPTILINRFSEYFLHVLISFFDHYNNQIDVKTINMSSSQHPLWVKTISRKSLSKQTLPVSKVFSIQNVWPTLCPLYENMTFLSGAREYTNSCPWFTAGCANVSSDITWKVKKDKNASQHFSEEKKMISYEKEINENAMPHIFRYFRMIRQKESLLINFKFLGSVL